MKKQVNWTNALSPRGLLAKAREAAFYAYAPYSGFQVGAALLFEDEQVLAACNVENASIGLSICAERNVVAAMVAKGLQAPVAIAVSGSKAGELEVPCPPCGACRQVLMEFAPDLLVVLGSSEDFTLHRMRDLLPLQFSLKKDGA